MKNTATINTKKELIKSTKEVDLEEFNNKHIQDILRNAKNAKIPPPPPPKTKSE